MFLEDHSVVTGNVFVLANSNLYSLFCSLLTFPGCDCQLCFLLEFSVKLCSSKYRGIDICSQATRAYRLLFTHSSV